MKIRTKGIARPVFIEMTLHNGTQAYRVTMAHVSLRRVLLNTEHKVTKHYGSPRDHAQASDLGYMLRGYHNAE